MGQTTAEKLSDIEQTRQRLSAELEELERRLPPPARAAQQIGVVLFGGGATGTVAWWALRRMRRRRRASRNEQHVQAVIQLVPDRWVSALESERAKQWVVAFAAVWMLVRLAELRRLRRLTQSLAAPR